MPAAPAPRRHVDIAVGTAAGTGPEPPDAPTIVPIGGLNSIIGSGSRDGGPHHHRDNRLRHRGHARLRRWQNRHAPTVTGTTWSYTLQPADIAALGQGSGKTITATATDLGGNSTIATSASFGVDAVAPGAPTVDVISGIVNSGQVITGTTDAGTTVALNFGTGRTAVAATVTGTSWSYTLVAADITALGQGPGRTFTATATDPGGTSGPATSASFSEPFSFTGSITKVTVGDPGMPAGTYDITAYGAQGGTGNISPGGKGAKVEGTVSLTAGEELEIIVGQKGGNGFAAGGGGGSFVLARNSRLVLLRRC